MHRSHKIALAVASVASFTAALAAPQVASAQPYDQRQVYSDQCQQQRTGHTILGAVLGGIAGAVIGNQVSHGDGTAWGGVAGAAVGAGVGNAANCDPQRYGDNYGRGDRYGDRYYRGNTYYDRDGGDYRGAEGYRGDSDGYYGQPSYGYEDQQSYSYDGRQGYGYDQPSYGYDNPY